ncbi:ATP-binding protein [Eubacteriales bacterium DFI.9.88]|nr:ATP-binding protein [Eubacteriales bacterium DFI.9.88]
MQKYKNEEIIDLINNLCKYEKEPPWAEFKCNNKAPEMIGEYVSALSNAAALERKNCGYLIWGIDDSTHNVVGTSFNFNNMKVGNEDIALWLTRQLDPIPYMSYRLVEMEEKYVGILKVAAANSEPIKFKGMEYIRRGEHKKKLKDCPDLERELWKAFSKTSFEMLIAEENVSDDEVLKLIDYPCYFDLLDLELPSDKQGILKALVEDKMLETTDFGKYNITNLGALLFARKLDSFEHLSRKAVRVVQYRGNSRTSPTMKEQVGGKGYASGFEGLISFINGLLPSNEVIGQALRKTVPMYPELSVREVIANAIIHQDLTLRGTGVLVEIFTDRIEISNPGAPLIETDRFIDHPPISRNEILASFLRRVGMCEERGSGFDKVVSESELYQLPAPEIELFDSHTKVTLFSYKEFGKMDKEDRIRACYMHACLKRVNREEVTNTSLRERFNVEKKNSSMISRLLKDTMDRGLIKLQNTESGDKAKKYLPYWA